MDSYFIEKSAENTDSFDSCDKIYGSYNFSKEDLEDIPHPDEHSFSHTFDSDEIHLPPPPGTCDQFPILSRSFIEKNPSPPHNACSWSSNVQEDELPVSINTTNIPIPDSFDCQVENISLPPPPPPPVPNTPPLPSEEEKEYKINQEENASCTQNENMIGIPEISSKKLEDDSKYSPSKVESDEENQESAVVKPKVLGKEAAKKRLMAFSLSKQPPSKKQNKTPPPVKVSKEKSLNTNKALNIQDVFRATISEIEEEKKKMLQNMPNHLILEWNDSSKCSPVAIPSSETPKNENAERSSKGISVKDEVTLNKSSETSKTEGPIKEKKSVSPNRSNRSQSKTKRSRSKSNRRSRSKSKKRRRSRSKKRSRSKSITNQSRNRKRSRSTSKRRRTSVSRRNRKNYGRNRRSGSRSKNFKEEKHDKSHAQDSSKKPVVEDWKSFKARGYADGESEEAKVDVKEPKGQKHPSDDCSPTRIIRARSFFRPVFNLLNKKSRLMASLRVKPADLENKNTILYLEKTLRYTRAKPIIHWAENPSQTTEYYMSKELLLENCDNRTFPILTSIIESGKKSQIAAKSFDEPLPLKNRPWYPRENYLMPSDCSGLNQEGLPFAKNVLEGINKSLPSKKESVENVINKTTPENEDELKFEEKSSSKAGNEPNTSRRGNSARENFLSDEDNKRKSKEKAVGVKTKTVLTSVKIRSKWDSDYEGETSEVEPMNCREEDMEISTSDDEEKTIASNSLSNNDNFNDFDVKGVRPNKGGFLEKIAEDSRNLSNSNDVTQPHSSDVPSNPSAGNLVSEYEEFLKMVSFDSCSADGIQSRERHFDHAIDAGLEDTKLSKTDKSTEESGKNFRVEITDWDQESDNEGKSNAKKMEFDKSETHVSFSSISEEKLELKKKKNKKDTVEKKNSGKMKTKKKKISKKSSKGKKKNYKGSSSSDSSSGSSDSDSYSDSDESHSPKRKKKKVTNKKKKSKRDSSSESESDDSDDDKSKKKKTKKKKRGKKKKSSSSESDEVHHALMKQLDFNKQLIMKKIEEIDYISERSGKKKGKENSQRKKDKQNSDESEILEKYVKGGKKKKNEIKSGKDKKIKSKNIEVQAKNKKIKGKKSKFSSESDSDDSESSVIKKKTKKERKKKQSSSGSSDSDEKTSKAKIQTKVDKIGEAKGKEKQEKKVKKIKKLKKKKKKEYSSSDSDSVKEFEKVGKKGKKGKKSEDDNSKRDETDKSDWKDNFRLSQPAFKASENRSEWEDKKSDWESIGKKSFEDGKKGDDWEASSPFEESPHPFARRESSWDDDVCSKRIKTEIGKEFLDGKEIRANGEKDNLGASEKVVDRKNCLGAFEGVSHQVSESLKTSMSNFSFNENSFCAFGQELSRDFFLMESNFSNSAQFAIDKTKETTLIEPRPFQSVNKSSDVKKTAGSELYSPGCSESEASDVETGVKTERTDSNTCNETREEVYDPLNCESEASGNEGNDEVELGNIPLPRVADILLPGESKTSENVSASIPLLEEKIKESATKLSEGTSDPNCPSKFGFTSGEFTPITVSGGSSACILKEDLNAATKKQVINVKGQRKLQSKAASVFQDESDDDFEIVDKAKVIESMQKELNNLKEKIVDNADGSKSREVSKKDKVESIQKEEVKKTENEVNRSRGKERSEERERRNCDISGERKEYTFPIGKVPSPRKTGLRPDLKLLGPSKGKPEIKSDSFEIEPLNSFTDSMEVEETVQRIPVVTGLGGSSSHRLSWNRSHMTAYNEFSEVSAGVIHHADSFDLYPANQNYDKDFNINDVNSTSSETFLNRNETNKTKERRKSRSRSLSPRKKNRSKSPERRKRSRSRSPRKRSASPKRRDKSPYSPRRRSPKRKSYRSSRSPERRRKSRSRSPRKRRNDSSRRSGSASPRKPRSPKRRGDSPRTESHSRSFSPRGSVSPRKDTHFNHRYSDGLQNRIPVLGTSIEDVYMEISPTTVSSPRLELQTDFPRYLPDSGRTVSEMNGSFYSRDYSDEFGIPSYSEEIGLNNLITVKNHDIEKPNSPERLSLDQRIELELGVPMAAGGQPQSEQYPIQNQVCQQFPEVNSAHFSSSYSCENTNSGDNFYQNQNLQINPELNTQYFNGHQQQPNYGQFPPYTNSQGVQSSVLQVGNIVEVVPTLQHPPPPPPPPLPSKSHQILQVGNVLQVVPSQKVVQPPQAVPPPATQSYAPPSPMAPVVKTQKATAVVAPSSIVPTPNSEAVINPLIKAIQLEREKRRKEKEKRRAEREARRKARQLRREAKLMSVNEKLKKSVQDEGLMLGQEVEDDELMDVLNIPSPPIPVEIITVSSQSTLPPAGKGILITAGFMPKPPSEKKEVKFADGVCPGEGTSTSGGEDIASPPPKPKLPKEKRYKKKKTKVKKKVKVQIIRQIIQDEDDEEDDDLSPPPPPPGDPPPVFFARFPFVGDAQFPIYQTQTTTTTLTTVQYPAQSFQ